MWSLADLCADMLQLELEKPSSLRTGNWEKRPLSVDQLFYAATDAYAGLRLWQVGAGAATWFARFVRASMYFEAVIRARSGYLVECHTCSLLGHLLSCQTRRHRGSRRREMHCSGLIG